MKQLAHMGYKDSVLLERGGLLAIRMQGHLKHLDRFPNHLALAGNHPIVDALQAIGLAYLAAAGPEVASDGQLLASVMLRTTPVV